MTTQDKLIAFVDGSVYSASVCEHAAWAAERSGWSLDLLHILDQPSLPERQDLSGAIALGARSALLADLADLDARRAKLATQHGRAILEDAEAILRSRGVQNITPRLRHGDIITTLAEAETDAALIVIGKRGEAADFAKGHLGTNVERLIRASHRPVLVAARAFRPIRRVLLAFDGGPSAKKAVDLAATSPLFRDLSLHLVTVGPTSAEAESHLAEARQKLVAAGIEAHSALHPGDPETTLAGLVDATPFDMVIMGAYGHSRIRKLIIGSTTTEMIRACKVPVLLVR
jgi:nucleotide-binding universal stress UspA family protein